MEFLQAIKAQALANPLAAVSTGVVIVAAYKSHKIVREFAESMVLMADAMREVADLPPRQRRRY